MAFVYLVSVKYLAPSEIITFLDPDVSGTSRMYQTHSVLNSNIKEINLNGR